MMVYDLAMESPLAAVLASIAPVAGAPMLGFLRDVRPRPTLPLSHARFMLRFIIGTSR
jgi:hypothetical protein